MLLLSAMVDAAMVVETVERPKDFVTNRAHGVVERLQVLLFLVPLERELGAEQFPAHVTAMASADRQRQAHPSHGCPPGTHTQHYSPPGPPFSSHTNKRTHFTIINTIPQPYMYLLVSYA